jgi:hypothetical protein
LSKYASELCRCGKLERLGDLLVVVGS